MSRPGRCLKCAAEVFRIALTEEKATKDKAVEIRCNHCGALYWKSKSAANN